MNQLNKYHYYINLEKRKERNIHCIDELKKIGINPRRFNAIEEKIGLIGCTKSHIKCVEIAKKKKWPFICIFEDDVLFINSEMVKYKINQYINYDYDVLYIGAWIRNNKYNKYNFITEDLIKVNYTCCLHAYIVKNHYYDILLNNLREGLEKKIKNPNNYKYNNDEYIQNLQIKDKWYCFYPILATQINGYSDNFNEIRNYKDIIMTIPKLLKENIDNIGINKMEGLHKGLQKNSKNISIQEDTENINTIKISKDFLQNLRNIIEVSNERITWKIEELLPVGLVIKQLDDLLKEDK